MRLRVVKYVKMNQLCNVFDIIIQATKTSYSMSAKTEKDVDIISKWTRGLVLTKQELEILLLQ